MGRGQMDVHLIMIITIFEGNLDFFANFGYRCRILEVKKRKMIRILLGIHFWGLKNPKKSKKNPKNTKKYKKIQKIRKNTKNTKKIQKIQKKNKKNKKKKGKHPYAIRPCPMQRCVG